jgi:hypothetical protein
MIKTIFNLGIAPRGSIPFDFEEIGDLNARIARHPSKE